MCTGSLGGGRRPARERASSDPRILERALPGDLYEVSERKTTVFRSQKLCVLGCYYVAFCGAFLTRDFPFIHGALHGPS